MVRGKTTPSKEDIPGDVSYQLKVTIREIKPPIWRRLLVPGRMGLDRLHVALQEAFGWWDYHLHAFQAGGAEYGVPDPDEGGAEDLLDDGECRLCDLVQRPRQKFDYQYDFGDDWPRLFP